VLRKFQIIDGNLNIVESVSGALSARRLRDG